MIIEEVLSDPELSQQDLLSYALVCKAWAGEVDRDFSLYTALQIRLMHLAARHNNIELLKILVDDYGVDVDSIDETGWIVAKRDCEQATKSFANDNETGWMVLHTAAFCGYSGMFEYLVQKQKALEGKDEKYIHDLSILAMCNENTGIIDTMVDLLGRPI
jgi:Ankyrin repeats (3 copies)